MKFKTWAIMRVLAPLRKELEEGTRANDEEGRYEGKKRICAPGLCDVYASDTAERLQQAGFNARIVKGKFENTEHWWVELDDGQTIVDLTADQFGENLPRILIGTYQQFPQYKNPKPVRWNRGQWE